MNCENSYDSIVDIGTLIINCMTIEELSFLKSHIETCTLKEKNKDILLTIISLMQLIFTIDKNHQ